MEQSILKNIDPAQVLTLKNLVAYQTGQIVSKTLVQNKNVSMTLFAFSKDEEISTHASHGDAFAYVMDGTGDFTVGDTVHKLTEGQVLIMPAEIPHAVYAATDFKMLLVVVFPL